jgi:hypothetical protein
MDPTAIIKALRDRQRDRRVLAATVAAVGALNIAAFAFDGGVLGAIIAVYAAGWVVREARVHWGVGLLLADLERPGAVRLAP